MKKNILLILFVFVTSIVNSQVITVELDTLQFFSHSLEYNTVEARLNDKIVYDGLRYESIPMSVSFDLDNMVETLNGLVNPIVKINNSTNLIDLEVNENGVIGLCILSTTESGKIIYIYETIRNNQVEGFFVINPTVIK